MFSRSTNDDLVNNSRRFLLRSRRGFKNARSQVPPEYPRWTASPRYFSLHQIDGAVATSRTLRLISTRTKTICSRWLLPHQSDWNGFTLKKGVLEPFFACEQKTVTLPGNNTEHDHDHFWSLNVMLSTT